ncbi:MAG: FtsX-like permease family protein, partial [Alphaproteobacteria bacterium]|nr:FtsX-like permease family protein [Alphaproteobacteria bacterium]
LSLIDGFAQIQPTGYSSDPDLRKAIVRPQGLMAQLNKVPGVTAAAPRGTTYAIFSDGPRSYGAAVFGVDPARETKVSMLGATIVAGRYLKTGDGAAVVIGTGLARNLRLTVGGKLTMLGSARDGTVAADVLTIVGIFSTGASEIDRQIVEMPLSRFQADFAMGQSVNLIAVSGRRLGDIEASLPSLRAVAERHGLVVRDWTDLEPGLNDVILLDMSFSTLMYVSLIVIVVFIILNTLLMSVLERTREFGMLMAIGMRPKRIGRMIWLELTYLAAIGAMLGSAAGCGITAWTAIHGIAFPGAEALFSQWHMPSILFPELNLVSALAGPCVIALAIAIAGFVPYARVRRLEPVSAMRAT